MTNIVRNDRCHCLIVCWSVWLCLCGLAAGQSATGSQLAAPLDELIDSHPSSRRSAISLKVVDLASGQVVYDRRGDQLMTPASNLKIYTGACALAKLGADHLFETKIRLAGSINNGELDGDLVLIGGGDPFISMTDLRNMAAAVVEKVQLKRVRGAVRVDNSRYRLPLKGPGWMWDDDPFYFNMSITPLMVDFNVLTVQVESQPDGQPNVQLVPPTDWPPLQVIRAESDSDRADRPAVSVTRQPFQEPIVVRNADSVSAADSPSEHRLTMHDPAPWVAAVFERMLADLGVEFETPAASKVPRIDPPLVMSFRGAKLRDILKHFQVESENAIGEMLLHEIAIADGVEAPNWKDGAAAMTRWLIDEAGLKEGSFRLADGSGLSRYNLIAADSSIRLLQYMDGHQSRAAFFDSLPTYDVAGTLPVQAKGGSMSSVSTCSGVIRTPGGKRLAFSYLTNGFLGSSKPLKELRQSIWETIASSDAGDEE